MPRPRKYIQVNGKVIDGVHRHRASGRYYILDHRGKQVYFSDWREARAVYQSSVAEQLEPVDRAKLEARASVRMAQAMEQLREDGQGSRADDMLFERVAERILREGTSAWVQFLERMNITADELGVPNYDIVEIGEPTTASEATEPDPADNPRLSKVGEAWLRGKTTEAGLEDVGPETRVGAKRCSGTRHMKDTMAHWQRFIDCVGDVPIGGLKPEHFRRFRTWADQEVAKRGSAHWQRALFTAIKGVFHFALERYPDWAWSPGITDRLRALKPKRYEPDESNAEPMPPSVFKRLLARCDVWAATDPNEFDTSTQPGRAKRLQALRKRRDGRQYRAILMLTCNCGLNAVDIERLEWSNLKLDVDVPHLALPRTKVIRSAGRAVSRRTPLLPAVVEELKRWRDSDSTTDARVFQTAQGTPIDSTQIARRVGLLLNEEGLDRKYTHRHLRNVGPTLASNAALPGEMADRFLGHKGRKMSNRYQGVKPITYLLPVVELIGDGYFN